MQQAERDMGAMQARASLLLRPVLQLLGVAVPGMNISSAFGSNDAAGSAAGHMGSDGAAVVVPSVISSLPLGLGQGLREWWGAAGVAYFGEGGAGSGTVTVEGA